MAESVFRKYFLKYLFNWAAQLGAKLDRKGSNKNITFSRRYLDPNRVTFQVFISNRDPQNDAYSNVFQFHSKRKPFDFDTLQGQQITDGLNALSKKFDLSFQFGTAPHDFTLSESGLFFFDLESYLSTYRSPYPSNNSLLTLFIENVSICRSLGHICWFLMNFKSGRPGRVGH